MSGAGVCVHASALLRLVASDRPIVPAGPRSPVDQLPPCSCDTWCGDDGKVDQGLAEPCPAEARRRLDGECLAAAWRIADESVIVEIQSNCPFHGDQPRWYDTRPLLDEREYGARVDVNRLWVGYALARGLVVAHGDKPWLVRVAVRPGA